MTDFLQDERVKAAREKRKAHRSLCSICHHPLSVNFHVPNEVWALAVHISQIESIICLTCFTRIADERGVEWCREIRFLPTSRVAWDKFIANETPLAWQPLAAVSGPARTPEDEPAAPFGDPSWCTCGHHNSAHSPTNVCLAGGDDECGCQHFTTRPQGTATPEAWRDLALRSANALSKVAAGCGPWGSFHGVMASDMADLAAKLSKAAHE